MKKILLAALIALCGVSFGFGRGSGCLNDCDATAQIEISACDDSECIQRVQKKREDCADKCYRNSRLQ